MHPSLDKFTCYRVEPFERYGIFETAKAAIEYCEGLG